MKILYSHRTLSADGQFVHIRCLTEALAARGHALTMVGPEGAMTVEEAAKPLDAGEGGGGGLKSLLPKPAYEFAEYLYSIPAGRKLAAACNAMQPDVIYERYNLFYHAGARLAKKRGLPFMLEVNSPLVEERSRHGGLALKGFAAKSEGAIWRAADAVMPVTQALADYVTRAGVDPARVHVIQNGVEPVFLTEIDDAAMRTRLNLVGKTVLGFTGFARDWHGLDRVIDFMAAHRELPLHLLLVGDGPVRESLEAQARDCGLSDRLTITGVVQREEVAGYVAAFDVALQPAVTSYASPLKLFEYMALGRAVIAPDQPNIREILDHGEDALLFPVGEDGAFQRALGQLIEAADLRQRLGAAARAKLLKRDYTWAGNAARVEAIASRLLEEKANAGARH